MYAYVAEPLADADEDAVEAATSEGEGHRLLEWVLGRQGDAAALASINLDERSGVNRKWLPHMSRSELYTMYQNHPLVGEKKAGRRCFFDVFGNGWKHC